MIVTTTHQLEGKKIEQYLGIVVGEAVMGANIFQLQEMKHHGDDIQITDLRRLQVGCCCPLEK